MSYNDYLAHHGVLGMKWGVRKQRSNDSNKPKKQDIVKKVLIASGFILATAVVSTAAYKYGKRYCDLSYFSHEAKTIRKAANSIYKSKIVNKKLDKKFDRIKTVKRKAAEKLNMASYKRYNAKLNDIVKNKERNVNNQKDAFSRIKKVYSEYGRYRTEKVLNKWKKSRSLFNRKHSDTIEETVNRIMFDLKYYDIFGH